MTLPTLEEFKNLPEGDEALPANIEALLAEEAADKINTIVNITSQSLIYGREQHIDDNPYDLPEHIICEDDIIDDDDDDDDDEYYNETPITLDNCPY